MFIKIAGDLAGVAISKPALKEVSCFVITFIV